MNTTPKHNISSENATDLIYDKLPLTDLYIQGALNIIGDDTDWNGQLTFTNCIVENIEGMFVHSLNPVKFINTF